MIIKKFKSPIYSKLAITDVEIENDISPRWDYKEGKIVTVGFIYGDEITIIQKIKSDNPEDFKKRVLQELSKYKFLYAFNFNMEKGAFYGLLRKYFDIQEIKPFKGKGWSKDKFYKTLQKFWDINCEIDDPFKGDGSKVIEAYKKGDYTDIINHNKNCLIKEAFILKHKKQLYTRFLGLINKDGWYVG